MEYKNLVCNCCGLKKPCRQINTPARGMRGVCDDCVRRLHEEVQPGELPLWIEARPTAKMQWAGEKQSERVGALQAAIFPHDAHNGRATPMGASHEDGKQYRTAVAFDPNGSRLDARKYLDAFEAMGMRVVRIQFERNGIEYDGDSIEEAGDLWRKAGRKKK